MSSAQVPRIALLGCGYWGKNLARVFHQLGALACICDPSPAGQKLAANLAPGVPVSNDCAAAWHESIDAVVVATPAAMHFDLASQALQAGKDVFVEKPLALSHTDGQRLVDLAKDKQRILMVGHVLEYHPAMAAAVQLVRSGVLGSIFYIYSNRLNLGKVRKEENVLWSFAPHDIAVILRLVGATPVRVQACGSAFLQPAIADTTVTNLAFANGIRAHLFVCWLHAFKEQRLVVIGAKQILSFDDVAKKLILYDKRIEWDHGRPIPVQGEGREIAFSPTEPLRNECEAFLDSIRTRQPPLTDGASGLRVLRVLQAAQQSLMADGQPVDLPIEAS